MHFAAAGETDARRRVRGQAAARAAEALAFDRAARLYRFAIELAHRPIRALDRAPSLRELTAARRRARQRRSRRRGGRSLSRRRRARTRPTRCSICAAAPPRSSLSAGHFSEGIAALGEVLRDGRACACRRRRRQALTSLLWRRARVRLRGLGWKRARRERAAAGDADAHRRRRRRHRRARRPSTPSAPPPSRRSSCMLVARRRRAAPRAARALHRSDLSRPCAAARTPRASPASSPSSRSSPTSSTRPTRAPASKAPSASPPSSSASGAAALEHCRRAEAHLPRALHRHRWEMATAQIFAIYAESLLGEHARVHAAARRSWSKRRRSAATSTRRPTCRRRWRTPPRSSTTMPDRGAARSGRGAGALERARRDARAALQRDHVGDVDRFIRRRSGGRRGSGCNTGSPSSSGRSFRGCRRCACRWRGSAAASRWRWRRADAAISCAWRRATDGGCARRASPTRRHSAPWWPRTWRCCKGTTNRRSSCSATPSGASASRRWGTIWRRCASIAGSASAAARARRSWPRPRPSTPTRARSAPHA